VYNVPVIQSGNFGVEALNLAGGTRYYARVFVTNTSGQGISTTVLEVGRSVTWEMAGYGGSGRFTDVTVDPSNSDVIYVGSDVVGIFKSIDGGSVFNLAAGGWQDVVRVAPI